MPRIKPLYAWWLLLAVVVAGLVCRHLPAWRSLSLTPATASARVVATGLDHGFVRYRFQAEGKTFEGTTAHHWLGGPWLELGMPVEIFYSALDPSVNQAQRPSAKDWWMHAVVCFLFCSVFVPLLIAGMLRRFVHWAEENTPSI